MRLLDMSHQRQRAVMLRRALPLSRLAIPPTKPGYLGRKQTTCFHLAHASCHMASHQVMRLIAVRLCLTSDRQIPCIRVRRLWLDIIDDRVPE